MPAVATRGRLRLKPIEGSLSDEVVEAELDLARADGTLTFGDLRRAAESFEAHSHHEAAHRLWMAVGHAAADLADLDLVQWAVERAEVAIARAGEDVSRAFRKSGVKFDYLAIAAARAEGQPAAEVALLHGCSVSTVGRAVEFAEERSQLLDRNPGFFSALAPGSDPDLLASFYSVDAKIMRWIVATNRDRRRSA